MHKTTLLNNPLTLTAVRYYCTSSNNGIQCSMHQCCIMQLYVALYAICNCIKKQRGHLRTLLYVGWKKSHNYAFAFFFTLGKCTPGQKEKGWLFCIITSSLRGGSTTRTLHSLCIFRNTLCYIPLFFVHYIIYSMHVYNTHHPG